MSAREDSCCHSTAEAGRLRVYRLPMVLGTWPWARQVNPCLEQVKGASLAWIAASGILNATQVSSFEQWNFGLLAGLSYPTAGPDALRVSCDLTNILFVFDGLTDVAEIVSIRQMADAFMDGMRYPDTPQSTPLGELIRQFWGRLLLIASPETQMRFLAAAQDYTRSVIIEAEDRKACNVRNMAGYLNLRRQTSALLPCFVLLQVGLKLPPGFLDHPSIVQLETLAADIASIGNDVYSYRVERARGLDIHNTLTVVQNQFGISLNSAIEWAGEYHNRLAATFLAAMKDVPTYGEEYDKDTLHYINGLGNMVRAIDSWSFETTRYFGSCGHDVLVHREFAMLPE